MGNGFILCDYAEVKREFPEFQVAVEALQAKMVGMAAADWAPLRYGGINPTAGQFGESTIMPPLFNDIAGTTMTTWDQWLTGLGHQTIMTGSATGGTIYEDYKIGLMGLVFLDKAPRITELKMQIGDRKYPRINVEEAFTYKQPAIIFEEGIPIDEETGFSLYAYVQTLGPARIKPIGVEMNRVPNKLQVTSTGAALS